jgi:hypothetical protein
VNDGTIDVIVSGGTGDYNYEWLSVGNQKQLNVPAGKYTVLVSEKNNPNCRAYASVEVATSIINYQSLEVSTQAGCDAVEVEVSILDKSPLKCSYTLSVSGGSTWPDDFYLQTKVDDKAVLFSPVPFSEVSIPVNEGSDLDIDLVSLIGDRWIFGPWTVSLKDANGNEIQSTVLNQQTDSKIIFSNLIASCNQVVPQYDFSWSPIDNISIIDGNNTSSVNLTPSIKTTYRVNASTNSNLSCILFQDIEAEKEVCTDVISFSEENISVYPNPSSNQIHINVPTALGFKSMQLFNPRGEEVFNTLEKSMQLSELPNGLYFLKIDTDERTISKKIVKK